MVLLIEFVDNWIGLGPKENCCLLKNMMTSSNGNIFRVTGPLRGEFTGHGEVPTQRPVTRSFDVFFDLRLNKRLSKQPWGWWFEAPSWSLWRQYNECAMKVSLYQVCELKKSTSLLASQYNPIANPVMVSTVRFYDRNELYGSPDVRNCRMPNFLGWAFFVISLININ